MTCTKTSTSDLSTGGTIFRKQKQADLTSMSPSAQTYPSWPKTTQWAVEAAGATKETATVVAMEEAVEATVVVAAALAIVVAVAAVEAVVEAAVAITTTTIVVAAEAAGEAKATMDGVAVIWEVVAGDLEAETTRSSSQQTSAMHLVVDAVATVEATIAATQAWRSALPLSITTEVVVEEAIAVVEVDLVTAVDGEAATATRRCTVSRLAAEANRSSKSHAATAKLFTLVI